MKYFVNNLFVKASKKKNSLYTNKIFFIANRPFVTSISSKLMFTAYADAWKMVFTKETTVLSKKQNKNIFVYQC